MGSPTTIRCLCCSATCVEVGHALSYPKSTGGPWPSGKEAKEHRYTCPECKKEWIYQTKWKDIYPVPQDAQFHISFEDGQEIIQTEDPDILTYWGLPPEAPAELTPEEVLRVQEGLRQGMVEEARQFINDNKESILRKIGYMTETLLQSSAKKSFIKKEHSHRFLLSLKRELSIFFALIGGDTAQSVLKGLVKDLGNPQTALM